jgi:hypothetical protein
MRLPIELRWEDEIVMHFGFGPMSHEVICALAEWTVERDEPLMLICSRNQIESRHLGGGYVMNTFDLGNFVGSLNAPKLMLCRDHSGPYLNRNDTGHDLGTALERTRFSLSEDIDAGFRLIHIDASACSSAEKEVATELFAHCKEYAAKAGADLLYEYGSEDNVGIAVSEDKFEADLKFVSDIVKPTFVVGQTGSLVRRARQVGTFDAAQARRLVERAAAYGTLLKEHNCDYLSPSEIRLRSEARVGAMNIAPELGSVHTITVCHLSEEHGMTEQWNAFRRVILDGPNWAKWQGENDDERIWSAGHYHFDSPEYADLIGALSERIDANEKIRSAVKKAVDRYTEST